MATPKEVEAVFDLFCKAIGVKKAAAYNDVGGYCLESNKPLKTRQYRIAKVSNDRGGISDPFGPYNYTGDGIISLMQFVISVIEERDRQKLNS